MRKVDGVRIPGNAAEAMHLVMDEAPLTPDQWTAVARYIKVATSDESLIRDVGFVAENTRLPMAASAWTGSLAE